MALVRVLFFIICFMPTLSIAQDEDPDFDYLEPETGILWTWKRFGENIFRQAAHPESYEQAKRLMYNDVQDAQSLYCGCTLDLASRKFDASACGYVPRNDNARAKRVEAEHVVPAYWLDKFHLGQSCWIKAPECGDARNCCLAKDARFRDAHNDLVNLVPAIGELNADRSNLLYGEIAGEARQYGMCDFEVDGTTSLSEPRPDIRGDVARIYFYMADQYALSYPANVKSMLEAWNAADPVSVVEKERNERILALQGHANKYVSE
ncbi:deoxyribonuclease-1 [Sinorhizobium fredii]|uniref:endonuclease n=1 Tax=Rhizobium fredii TaxID=380 RepID=UPI003514D837